MGLSKIGGLIALFKLASLLQLYHKSKFEKEYAIDNQVGSDDENKYSNHVTRVGVREERINTDTLMMNETNEKDIENLQGNDNRVSFKEIFTFSNFEMMMR